MCIHYAKSIYILYEIDVVKIIGINFKYILSGQSLAFTLRNARPVQMVRRELFIHDILVCFFFEI